MTNDRILMIAAWVVGIMVWASGMAGLAMFF
jgi:hypothetical protein